jgi:hypothetical protein
VGHEICNGHLARADEGRDAREKPAISTPPTSSITAATATSGGKGPDVPENAAGKPKSFTNPCSRNRRAVTIRRTARICGDHCSSFGMGGLLLFKDAEFDVVAYRIGGLDGAG